MTTNKPEVVGYRYKASKSRGKWHYQQHWPSSDNMAVAERGECEPLIRLTDYEALQAERDALREALFEARATMTSALSFEPGINEVTKKALAAEIERIKSLLSEGGNKS